jgi:hypothetical protein
MQPVTGNGGGIMTAIIVVAAIFGVTLVAGAALRTAGPDYPTPAEMQEHLVALRNAQARVVRPVPVQVTARRRAAGTR